MPAWQGKSKATSLGYRLFIIIIRKTGLGTAYFVLYFVAAYFFLFSRYSSRVIYQYFRERIGYSRWKSTISIFFNNYIFGQTLMDKIVLMAGFKQQFTFEFEGEENLRKVVAGGKGGILLSAHLGNWEAAGHLLERLHTRINVVMYDGEHQKIKSYLDGVTGEKNFHVIVIKKDQSHVYEIGDALQKNELICLHADRFLQGNKTLQTKFLGEEALFPEGPFALAAAFKVPVCIVFAFKEGSKHYHLFSTPIFQAEPEENKRTYLARLFANFVGEMEEKVKRFPLQWFNYYPFWMDNK